MSNPPGTQYSEPVYPYPEMPPFEAIAATAIMPWSLRSRHGVPIAVPVGWSELARAESAVAMRFADAGQLTKRARKLRGWSEPDQALPAI